MITEETANKFAEKLAGKTQWMTIRWRQGIGNDTAEIKDGAIVILDYRRDKEGTIGLRLPDTGQLFEMRPSKEAYDKLRTMIFNMRKPTPEVEEWIENYLKNK